MSVHGIVLRPFAWLYALVVGVRNMLYDRGILAQATLTVPVVSVGNLTAGGTGKTPLVSYLTDRLEAGGARVAIVGRGYRRKSKGTVVVSDGTGLLASPSASGDELFLLARRHPRAVVVADERRVRGASTAVARYGAQVVILDDGFQHRALSREMDIVMIDAANRLPDIPMLPSGLRREPLGALRRASLVVFSNVSGAADDDWLGRYTSVPVARVRTSPLGVRRLHEESPGPVTGLAGKRCLAFCGIGNPEALRATAERAGLRVAAMKVFRDHVWYGPEELRQVQAAFAGSGAELLLTTEKDAVKLAAAGWAELPVYVLAAGLEFLSGGDVLDEGLRKLMSRQTP